MNFTKSIENWLNNTQNKNIIIKQFGFIESIFEITNFNYEIKYELLKIFNKESQNCITMNLNQVYKTINEIEKIILYMDNDTTLSIEVKR